MMTISRETKKLEKNEIEGIIHEAMPLIHKSVYLFF